jgi:hypothetical protein
MNILLTGFAMAEILKMKHFDWSAQMLQRRVRMMHGFV